MVPITIARISASDAYATSFGISVTTAHGAPSVATDVRSQPSRSLDVGARESVAGGRSASVSRSSICGCASRRPRSSSNTMRPRRDAICALESSASRRCTRSSETGAAIHPVARPCADSCVNTSTRTSESRPARVASPSPRSRVAASSASGVDTSRALGSRMRSISAPSVSYTATTSSPSCASRSRSAVASRASSGSESSVSAFAIARSPARARDSSPSTASASCSVSAICSACDDDSTSRALTSISSQPTSARGSAATPIVSSAIFRRNDVRIRRGA